MARGGSGSLCCAQALVVSTQGQFQYEIDPSVKGAYVAANRYFENLLGICPDHAIRSEVGSHSRGLPCEDDSAILRW